MKVAFVSTSVECLGIEYISAMLKPRGHEVRLFMDQRFFNDEYITVGWLSRLFDSKKRIIEEIKTYKPDIIGFSVMSDFYPWACEIARLIKKEMNVPIIFGGIHPTSVPERVIKNDFVDVVCISEGEYPMLELANSMDKGAIDYSIKNLWFKKNGKVIRNDLRPLLNNLDSLPIADKDIYYTLRPHYSDLYYISTSRGCKYSCSYCCHSYARGMYNQKISYFRRRSIANVIQEIEAAQKKYKIKHVRFFDESFGADLVWLREFSKQYKKIEGRGFVCYMHPNDVTAEAIGYLKEAGCFQVELGVQSLTERINQQIFKRNSSNAKIALAIDIIKNAQINLATDNILGIPGQTDDDIIKLIEFYNQRRVNRIYFYWLRFYPKTDLTEWAKETGLLSETDYKKIADGQVNRTYLVRSDGYNKSFIKLQFLIFLMPYLTRNLVRFFLRYRLYRFFYVFHSPIWLAMFASLRRYLKKNNGENLGFFAGRNLLKT